MALCLCSASVSCGLGAAPGLVRALLRNSEVAALSQQGMTLVGEAGTRPGRSFIIARQSKIICLSRRKRRQLHFPSTAPASPSCSSRGQCESPRTVLVLGCRPASLSPSALPYSPLTPLLLKPRPQLHSLPDARAGSLPSVPALALCSELSHLFPLAGLCSDC